MEVIGVAWAGTAETYSEFVNRHSLTFPNIDDTPGTIYAKYGVPYQPAWVFISRDGAARTMRGALEPTALRDALGELSGT